MEKKDILENLVRQKDSTRELLKEKRLSLGKVASAKESRFPMGRVELENEIFMLENKLGSLKAAVKDLEKYSDSTKTQVEEGAVVKLDYLDEEMEVFVSTGFADLDLGVLSINAPIIKAVYGKKAGETVDFNGKPLKVISVS